MDQSLLLYRYHPGAATHSVLEYVGLGSRRGRGEPSQVSAPRWGPGSVADTRAHGLPGGRSSPVCGPAFSSGSRLNVCSHFYYLFQLLWVFVAAQAISSCSEQGLLSSCSSSWGLLSLQSAGSGHLDFSSCGSRSLEHELSSCDTGLFPCGTWDLISWTEDQTRVPCMSRQIPNPWTMAQWVKNLPAVPETQETWVRFPGSARFPEGSEYSCLKTSMGRGAWQATVQRLDTAEQPGAPRIHM